MNKQEALKLIADLVSASVNHYRCVNEANRGSSAKAATAEWKAALRVISALTPEPPTDEELESALGW